MKEDVLMILAPSNMSTLLTSSKPSTYFEGSRRYHIIIWRTCESVGIAPAMRTSLASPWFNQTDLSGPVQWCVQAAHFQDDKNIKICHQQTTMTRIKSHCHATVIEKTQYNSTSCPICPIIEPFSTVAWPAPDLNVDDRWRTCDRQDLSIVHVIISRCPLS